MKLAKIAYFLCAAGIAVNVAAEGALHTEPATDNADLKGIIRNLLQDNASFVGSHKSNYYKSFMDGQHPRATVVTCSFGTHLIPVSEQFSEELIRRIGGK